MNQIDYDNESWENDKIISNQENESWDNMIEDNKIDNDMISIDNDENKKQQLQKIREDYLIELKKKIKQNKIDD